MHRQAWLLAFVFFVRLSSASLFGEYRFLRATPNCGGCATRCLLKEKKCEPEITRPNTPECDKSCEPSRDIVCTLDPDNGECMTTGQSTDSDVTKEKCPGGFWCESTKSCVPFPNDCAPSPASPSFVCGKCPCKKVEGKTECKKGEAKNEVCKKCNYECRLIDDQCRVVFGEIPEEPTIECKTPSEKWCAAKEACMMKEECDLPKCKIGEQYCAVAKNKCMTKKDCESFGKDIPKLPPLPTRPPSPPFICGNCPCNKIEGKAKCKKGEAKAEVCKKCNYECRLIDDQCREVFGEIPEEPTTECKTPGEKWCSTKRACMKKEECAPPIPPPPSVCECTVGTMKCKGNCENDKKSELTAEGCTNPKQPLYCPRYKHCVAYDDECNGETALPIVDCKPCPVGSLRPCKNSKGLCKSSEYQTCPLSKSKRDANQKTPIACPAGSKRVKAGDCVAFEVECDFKHQVICKKKAVPSPNPST